MKQFVQGNAVSLFGRGIFPGRQAWLNCRYCSRLAQTVTDFADAPHSKSAKSTTTTVLYGIFSSENSCPCAVANCH